MRVLLSTIGSRGDVQPLVALASELKTLGQDVRLCVPPDFRGWIESLGARLEARGLAADVARRIARFSLAAIEGALLLAKVGRSRQPLVEAGETLRAMVGLLAAAR